MRSPACLLVGLTLLAAIPAYADPLDPPALRLRAPRVRVPHSKKTIAGEVLVGLGAASLATAMGSGLVYAFSQIACGIGQSAEPGPASDCSGTGATARQVAIGAGVSALALFATGVTLWTLGHEDDVARRAARSRVQLSFGAAPLLDAQGVNGATLSIGGRF